MADGYAGDSRRTGVAFVITGPGLTKTLTAMAHARADSVPMLVVSGVNRLDTIAKGLGYLQIPDQQALAGQVALHSQRVTRALFVRPTLDRALRFCQLLRIGLGIETNFH